MTPAMPDCIMFQESTQTFLLTNSSHWFKAVKQQQIPWCEVFLLVSTFIQDLKQLSALLEPATWVPCLHMAFIRSYSNWAQFTLQFHTQFTVMQASIQYFIKRFGCQQQHYFLLRRSLVQISIKGQVYPRARGMLGFPEEQLKIDPYISYVC